MVQIDSLGRAISKNMRGSHRGGVCMGGRAGSGKILSLLLLTPGLGKVAVGSCRLTLSRQFLCWAYQAGARTVTVVGRTFITLCREMVSSNTSRLEIRESRWREDRWSRKFLNI